MDYKQFKLKDCSELIEFAELDMKRFYIFFNKVYSLLDNLSLDKVIFIRDIVNEKDVELFIKIVCFYIDEHRALGHIEEPFIEFLDDYSGIVRRKGFDTPEHNWCRSHFYK